MAVLAGQLICQAVAGWILSSHNHGNSYKEVSWFCLAEFRSALGEKGELIDICAVCNMFAKYVAGMLCELNPPAAPDLINSDLWFGKI